MPNAPSQVALEKPTLLKRGTDWSLPTKNTINSEYYTQLFILIQTYLCPPCLLPRYHLEQDFFQRTFHDFLHNSKSCQPVPIPANFNHVTPAHVPGIRANIRVCAPRVASSVELEIINISQSPNQFWILKRVSEALYLV